jgi:hypothetical protein
MASLLVRQRIFIPIAESRRGRQVHKIRITSLAQNIGVKSRLVLEVLAELGMASGKSRGSSLNETEAAKVWAHFERRGIFASIGRTLTAGDSAKEQKTICPACKRSVDRGKLPIHIRNPYLAPEVSATLRFVKCPLCKMRYSKNTRLAFLQKARQIKPSPLSSAVEGGASDGLFLKKPLLEMAVAKKLVAKNPIVKEKFGRMSGRTPLRILSVQTSEQDFDASCCIPCNQCGHLIREDAMVLHYENNHSEPVKGNSPGLPDTNFPFELLPAGTWDFRHALEYGYNPFALSAWILGPEI